MLNPDDQLAIDPQSFETKRCVAVALSVASSITGLSKALGGMALIDHSRCRDVFFSRTLCRLPLSAIL